MKLLTIVAAAGILFSCNGSKQMTDSNKLSATEKSEGWQLLFDGKTTKGWHKYGGEPVGSAWQVRDGVLLLDTVKKADWQTSNGGDIVTDEEFENYHLQLDWKIAKNGNSGIIFNIHEDKVKYQYPWYTGMEMQILDNDGHADGKYPKHRAGDLYDIIKSTKETAKPVGEWNHAEIKLLNGKLDLYLNGENVVSTTLWTEDWKKLLQNSKFKSMADFGTYKKGRIGLQDHGNEVQFRNIKIKRL